MSDRHLCLKATYLLPVRAEHAGAASELAAYVNDLPFAQIIVVDGSPPHVFAAYDALLSARVTHVAPSPIPGSNGKARGVLTGLALAHFDEIVVADDDVRYDAQSAQEVLAALRHADVVRPQNYFWPLPWHAVLDSARSLINRALDGDWPGTLALRKQALPHGYNADVLFENYELVQTIRDRGGREFVARDVFVRRLPPSTQHFLQQRVRQAYDEFARPVRMVLALSILPACITAVLLHASAAVLGLAALSIATATAGWLSGHAGRFIPAIGIAAAPLWVLERSICSWVALYERLRFGGVRYAGGVLKDAATPRRLRKMVWAA